MYFDSTLILFEKFKEKKLQNESDLLTKELFNEGIKRLQQLNLLLDNAFILLEAIKIGCLLDIDKTTDKIKIPDILKTEKAKSLITNKTNGQIILELQTNIESAYYFAWRFIKICNTDNIGFKKFHSKGISLVRNKLLEHPSLDAWFNNNFKIDNLNGYYIRHSNSVLNKVRFKDSGMMKNLEEFKISIEKKLMSRLNEM